MSDSSRRSRTEHYYNQELDYLRDGGREYAQRHPERASYLSLEDPRARDPHVERLIESTAFLTGGIREKIEDDFPELTHALLDLVWPHYLRPIPSLALLQMHPVEGQVRSHQRVPKGFLVRSGPTSQEVPCRFQTGYPVDLYPLRLVEAGMETDEAGQRKLVFHFELEDGADGEKISLDCLRLQLAGEPATAFRNYWVLRRLVSEVRLNLGRGRKRTYPSAETIRRVGFAAEEEILPYPGLAFPGYRLLSEYFAFPEKFLFVDLVGLGPLTLERGERRFSLELSFRRRPEDSYRPTAEEFRLWVTPVVNLFGRDGEPIRVSHLKTAYPVIADHSRPDAYEVIAVDEVRGLRRSDREARELASFYSFDHESGAERHAEGVWYHVTHRIAPGGGWRTYLSLVSRQLGSLPEEETLSLSLTCTNGRLCEEVGLKDIKYPAGERLDFVTFTNVTRPTQPLYPALGGGAEWRFISHMALNFLSLADAAALRRILSLYDTADRPANRRRIESVEAVETRPRETLVGGAPVRGTELTLTLDERKLEGGPGDVLLFGEVLSEFFSLYAHVNSFTRLKLVCQPSEEELIWEPAVGKRGLL
jgi:type VI secretion system protein ImpG